MKTRIELSCVADDLTAALYEVQTIVHALNLAFIDVKVFKDKNRNIDKGHSWVTVTSKSSPAELYQIYELKEKLAELTANP